MWPEVAPVMLDRPTKYGKVVPAKQVMLDKWADMRYNMRQILELGHGWPITAVPRPNWRELRQISAR
jgi:hypothetical protein